MPDCPHATTNRCRSENRKPCKLSSKASLWDLSTVLPEPICYVCTPRHPSRSKAGRSLRWPQPNHTPISFNPEIPSVWKKTVAIGCSTMQHFTVITTHNNYTSHMLGFASRISPPIWRQSQFANETRQDTPAKERKSVTVSKASVRLTKASQCLDLL